MQSRVNLHGVGGCFTKSIGFYFDALQDVVGSYSDGSGTPAMKVTGG